MKTWFITGISRGFGLSLTRAALARGDTVVGTVRAGTAVDALYPESDRLHVLTLDMAEGETIPGVVADAIAKVGRVDVVVNNAGYGLLGAFESATDAEMARLFEVDVFGPIRLIRAFLPHLRAAGGGHVINITSIAGRAPGAGSVLYAAAKHAMEGVSAALANEVAPTGIKVTAVAPGAFRTDFFSDHSIRRSAAEDAAYASTVGRVTTAFAAKEAWQPGDPDRAAEAILALADSPEPPVHLLLGSDALQRTRAKLDTVVADMAAWEATTLGTDFPKG